MDSITQPAPAVSYSPRPGRQARGINARMIVFLILVTAPFVWLVVNYASSQIHKGIQHVGNYDLVDLKALGYYPFDQNTGTINEVPTKWRNLDGHRIALEGFMYAGQSAAGQLSEFQFVYNVTKCCFSGPPQVQERVFARVPQGKTVPYYGDFCKVTGILHVDVKKVDGVIVSVYTLDVESAELES
jgi:hypothetical protein